MERRIFTALEAGEAFRFVFPRLPDDFYSFPRSAGEAEDEEDFY